MWRTHKAGKKRNSENKPINSSVRLHLSHAPLWDSLCPHTKLLWRPLLGPIFSCSLLTSVVNQKYCTWPECFSIGTVFFFFLKCSNPVEFFSLKILKKILHASMEVNSFPFFFSVRTLKTFTFHTPLNLIGTYACKIQGSTEKKKIEYMSI